MRLVLLALFLAAASILQGCFPLAAAGVGATAVVLSDRRAPGVYVEDENIEWKVRVQLLENFKPYHINATSYNQSVLLTGQTLNEQTKKDIEAAVRSNPTVKNIINEITIGDNSSLATRSNDSLITTNVKARILGIGKVSATHVKVITESNVVYLMGILKREEAENATEIARTSSGVSRVVRAFEYLDEAPKR